MWCGVECGAVLSGERKNEGKAHLLGLECSAVDEQAKRGCIIIFMKDVVCQIIKYLNFCEKVKEVQ